MSVTEKVFGKDPVSGQEVKEYTLENRAGMKVGILNYGAIISKLLVPDSKGATADVVTGFDTLDGYAKNPAFFGAVIGPNANRIGKACFTIDGVEYHIPVNDGVNNMHSDMEEGYHKRIFDVVTTRDQVILSLKDKDGAMGFPGNKCLTVTYTLTERNELKIRYEGESDKNTLLNFTNHTYFNLRGHKDPTILDHELTLFASNFTPTIEGSIPTGEFAPVEGTPMDFRKGRVIGKDIDADTQQLKIGGGYDHNWVIDGADGQMKLCAVLTAPGTDRKMKVYTTLPGIQFYAGNFIGEQSGKDGASYHNRCALALETQIYPDSVHHDAFPDAVFGPDRRYLSETIYAFEN